ncbi:MAG: ABC transporter permease [Leptospiraceae bacterium]|nr:ABC transporter permease [Leptospiraceae bacterium]
MSIREFIREPEVLFWAFVFPIGIAITLGLAFDTQKEIQYPIGVLNHQTNPNLQQEILKKLQAHNFHIKILSENEIEDSLKKREIFLYLEFHLDQILVHYDQQNSEAKEILLELYRILSPNILIEKEIKIPGTRYLDFLIPGLIAMGIMNSALWGIGWFLIQMRIKKLLKIFSTTPLNKNHFFIAFTLARGLLSVIENLFLVLVIRIFFPITFVGSWLDLIFVYLVGYLSFAGISVLASCRAKNTSVANGIMNAITLPMMLLSGIFFSYEYFPQEMVIIIEYLPLTLLADLLREVFIQGSSFFDYYLKLITLFFEGLICYVLGKRYFLWK